MFRGRIGASNISIGFLALTLAGCAHTIGQATLTDGNILRVVGRGEDVSTTVQCLTPDAISKLTGSNISSGAPTQGCYTVVSISAKSSGISNAVAQFAQQYNQLQTQGAITAASAAGKAAPASAAAAAAAAGGPAVASAAAANPAATGLVTTIVSAAVSNPTNPSAAAQTAASNAAGTLAPEVRSSAQRLLQSLSATATDPKYAGALSAAANKL